MIKIIGIDPDLEKPGICLLCDGKIECVESVKIEMIIEDIPIWASQGYIFAVENVEAKKTTFKRKGTSDFTHAKIAQDVGKVKGAARIIIKMIEHHGGTVILVPPGINSATKKDAKLFKEITGFSGRTNEDNRDAWAIAMWAYKKEVPK